MQSDTFFKPLYRGKLLRLAAPHPEDAEAFARWSNDDHYLRHFENDPARPINAQQHADWERPHLAAPNSYIFRLRTLEDARPDADKLIGVVALGDVQWVHRTAMLGIAIGERAYRGRGYGSEAIRLLLRYGFEELNLYRIWLTTISFNLPAIRCYERAGFVREGAQRAMIEREGRRFDLLYFGMIRDEWRDAPP